ncbi:MAG: hypothetical protein V4726_09965 [Verrucomicrobiota bacterium]
MSSTSLPCPVCATPLILDQENAGLEALCPGCGSHLRLPTQLESPPPPSILRRADPASGSDAPGSIPPAAGENWFQPPAAPASPAVPPSPAARTSGPDDKADDEGGKKPGGSALPSGRPKSDEEERRRLAGAAAAMGGAHSFTPEEAAQLAAERAKTVLPGRRRMTDAPPVTGAAFAQEKRDQAEPGMKRFGETAPEPELKPTPITPLSPKIHQQVELSPSPLTGGARSLPQAPARVAPVPVPAPETPAESPEESGARGGFRLNERTPQFVPQEIVEMETDAKEWGGEITPQETARTRRVVTFALAVMLLIAGGVGIYVMRHAFEPPVAESKTKDSGEDPMKNVQDARVVLKRFLAASSVEEMLPEVRHPEETKSRMERFYASRKITPLGIRNESAAWSEASIGNKNFISNTMELDDFDIRAVSLEIVPNSQPKVDWESFVNWSDIPWAEFLQHPPDDAVEFRVSAVQDNYYNGAFEGREFDMLCFKLRSPKKSQYEFCYGYCDKNSEVGTQILFMQRRSRQARKFDEKGSPLANCILRLRFSPEGKKFNQVLIEKMIFQGWVQP